MLHEIQLLFEGYVAGWMAQTMRLDKNSLAHSFSVFLEREYSIVLQHKLIHQMLEDLMSG